MEHLCYFFFGMAAVHILTFAAIILVKLVRSF